MHKETFYTDKDIKDFKIALFSDLHYYPNYPSKTMDSIINQIKENNVDYITIAGDILDSSDCTDLDQLKEFLTKLANIAPTIVITGNHDEKAGHRHHWQYVPNEKLIDVLKSIKNLYYIDNNNYEINNINFYGIKLSYDHYSNNEHYDSFVEEINKLDYKLNKKNYNITLIHSPINIYNYLKKNKESNLNETDLILSGHMHNGCLPYWISNIINKLFHSTRSIISPDGSLFPKYSQGRNYEKDGYIYQGISKLSKSTRILHFFERFYMKKITIIEIKKHH
ncbi:MAG: metallophosphoesterase [Bacilli bacterium]|nr:metallophosphoesterase [Bacilli bacterium]